MQTRLNYYSRYNRIKSPQDIDSLYHLISGLNLDSILGDCYLLKMGKIRKMSISEAQKNFIRKLDKQFEKSNGSSFVPIEVQGDSSIQSRKRYASCGKGHQIKIKKSDKKAFENYVVLEQKIKTSRQSHSNYILEMNSQQSQNQNVKLSSKRTNSNLSEMKCLETESIPDSHNQLQVSSPVLEMKKYEQQLKIEEKQIFINSDLENKNEKRQNYIKSSVCDDQFSEALAELNKFDEMRNSYYKENKLNQKYEQIECSKSEQLQRIYDSDFSEFQQKDDQVKIGDSTNYIPNKDQITHKSDKQVPVSSIFGKYNEQKVEQNNKYKMESISIEQRIEHKNQKIPEKGLTSGKWPNSQTQKSIEVISQFIVPSTIVIKSSENSSNITQKERKPFKKFILDKKLNPRMVISTIMLDSLSHQNISPKKVNFKRVIKKQNENKVSQKSSPIQKQPRSPKMIQQNQRLIRSFFQKNQ